MTVGKEMATWQEAKHQWKLLEPGWQVPDVCAPYRQQLQTRTMSPCYDLGKRWGPAVGITCRGVTVVLLPRHSFLRSELKTHTHTQYNSSRQPLILFYLKQSPYPFLKNLFISLLLHTFLRHPSAPLPTPAYSTSLTQFTLPTLVCNFTSFCQWFSGPFWFCLNITNKHDKSTNGTRPSPPTAMTMISLCWRQRFRNLVSQHQRAFQL